MRWIYYLITLSAILICWLLIYSQSLDMNDIGSSAIALVGTFIGATLAFRLNEEKESKENAEKQRQAVNRALFILMRQENAIVQISRELDKFPNEFVAAFNMPAYQPPRYDDLIYDISGLEFLLESSDINLLLELTVEQERFYQAIDSVKLRNEFYVGEVQMALSKLAMNKKRFFPEVAEALLGDRIYGGAINYANNIKEHVYGSKESLPSIANRLRVVAKELFPDHKFLQYEIPEEQHEH